MGQVQQVQQLIQENYFFLRRVREDMRYGQEAKARWFIMQQIIGPYNLDQLWYADQSRPPQLIREDLLDWPQILEHFKPGVYVRDDEN